MRIKELTEATSTSAGDYVAVDSNAGTKKYDLSKKADKTYVDANLSTKIGDAKKDGNSYVRKNGEWRKLTEGSVEEAPMDGEAYVRVSGEWVNASFVFEKKCADEVLDAGDISILADEVLSESGEEMVLVEE